MSKQRTRFALILIALALFATGCGLIQASQPPARVVSASPTVQTAAGSASRTAQKTSPTLAPSASKGDTIQLTVVPGKSEARYRVREQLVDVPLPSDAVGRTQAITGTIVGKTDGAIMSSDSKFVVDLRTLQSDRSQRDNFIRTSVLQTNQYPNATFVPTKVDGLPLTLPPQGKVTFKLIGDLTIRNVTKQVTWDVTCDSGNNQGACQATTTFKFDYFNLSQPRVPVVLSVQDSITLEVDVNLQRVSS